MKKSINILVMTLLAIVIPILMISLWQEMGIFSVLVPAVSLMAIIVLLLENRVAWYLFSLISIYLVPAVILGMEVLIFNETKNNARWFVQRYTYRMFKFEFFLFSPIIIFLYLISMLIKRKFIQLSYKKIFLEMEEILRENGKNFFNTSRS